MEVDVLLNVSGQVGVKSTQADRTQCEDTRPDDAQACNSAR